jgi:hypothetical protein
MNKFLMATMLAVCALTISGQRASAWGCGNGSLGVCFTIGSLPWHTPAASGGGGGCTFGYPSDWFSTCYGWPTGCDYGSGGAGYADTGYSSYPSYPGNIPYTVPSTTTPYVPPAPKPVPDSGNKPAVTRAYPSAGYQPVSYYPYPPTGSGWYGR